jgi:hypothetical protein
MSKTITSIHGFNFAGYQSVMINLSDQSNYFIGPNGAGKSKLGLDLVWFVMQGIAEMGRDGKNPLIGERWRFIGPDGATAMGELMIHDDVDNYDVRVIRKLTKTGTELSFSGPVGMELDQDWLNKLFNIFLISPKSFINLSSREQSLALGIDTSKWDETIAKLKTQFTEINKELAKLNKLPEVEKADRPPMDLLKSQKQDIKAKLASLQADNKSQNDKARTTWQNAKLAIDQQTRIHNDKVYAEMKVIEACTIANNSLISHGCTSIEVEDFINDLREDLEDLIMDADIPSLYPPEPTYIQEIPDDAELVAIDLKIEEAAGQAEKALLYEQYLEQMTRKGILEKELDQNKRDQASCEQEIIDYIKAFAFPFKELSVDEGGGLLLRGKPLKPQYFSSGELISIIPTLFASRNPDFKYVFIQDANLLDADTLKEVEEKLVADGFQIVFEYVGKQKLIDKNCILLRSRAVVHDERLMDLPVNKKGLTAADPEMAQYFNPNEEQS